MKGLGTLSKVAVKYAIHHGYDESHGQLDVKQGPPGNLTFPVQEFTMIGGDV